MAFYELANKYKTTQIFSGHFYMKNKNGPYFIRYLVKWFYLNIGRMHNDTIKNRIKSCLNIEAVSLRWSLTAFGL